MEEYLQKARHYCSRYESCCTEVRKKLKQWEAPEADIEAILEQLVAENYIDEVRYAASYIKDKILAKWGRVKIKYQLSSLGISESHCTAALAGIDQERYSENLSYLINHKLSKIKARDAYERKAKLYNFLLQRGYLSEEIGGAIAKLVLDFEQ